LSCAVLFVWGLFGRHCWPNWFDLDCKMI
jgi:hypothetical protein